MLALAPAAFAAGLATETANGPNAVNSAPNAAVSGQHHANGTETAANGSSDMSATGKTEGTTSGPAANSNVVPNTAVTKDQKNGEMHTAQTGTNGSSEMSSSHKASLGAGAPGTAAKPGTEAGTAPAHETSKQ